MKPESTKKSGSHKTVQEEVKSEFRKVTDDLWDARIRTALIFRQDMYVCRTCLNFFSKDDGPHDHPTEQVFQLAQLCTTKTITNEDSFFLALWADALSLWTSLGVILTPGFSTKHVQPPPVKPEVRCDSQNQWLQTRVFLLEQQIVTMSEAVKQLNAENHHMKAENNSLLQQVLHMKHTDQSIQWRARQHLEALQGLLTPDFAPDTDKTPLSK